MCLTGDLTCYLGVLDDALTSGASQPGPAKYLLTAGALGTVLRAAF